ncbi:MAG: hypothetical protein NZ750_04220 [Anaerolineae bacterium]|nr:hypothetical protein [Anaerolineae bacterium]MDW8171527.1 hypothetical protein [Anaerolineae bacterium]
MTLGAESRRAAARVGVWLAWLVPLWIIFGLYAPALSLPFYSDDVQILAYVEQATPWRMFSEASFNVQFYRPLANLVFKYAPPDPLLWHFAIVGLHLVNTALVGALARHLGLSKTASGIAMVTFGTFAFNAQAVLWVAAFYHLAPAFLVLLAGLALLKAQRGSSAWGWLAVLCAAAAPFFIENGVLAAPLLALLLGWDGFQPMLKRWRCWLPHLFIISLMSSAYVLLRAAVLMPIQAQVMNELPVDQKLAFNLPYLLQGFTLPIQGLWMRLEAEPTTQAWLGAGSFGLIIIALALITRPRLAEIQRYSLALLWIAALLIPNVVGLDPAYVAYSERTLYLASAGMALGLGLLLWRVPRSLGLALLALLLLAHLTIADDYVRLVTMQGRAYGDLAEDLRSLTGAETKRLMLINLPTHIEQRTPYAPLARAHAAVLTNWVDLGHFITRLSGQRFAAVDHYYVPSTFPTLENYRQNAYWSMEDRPFEVWEAFQRFGDYDLVAVSSLTSEGYSVRLIGQQAQTNSPPLADWGSVRLLGIEGEQRRDGLRLALTWHRQGAVARDLVPFVQAMCGGVVQAQADGEPLAGYYAFYLWDDGAAWTDYRTLSWPSAADCTILVGLYHRDSGQRLIDHLSGSDALRWQP